MKKIFKRGFTLLEILVVIGIISILVALAATSYASAQKKARDAKRKSDLKSIQNAYEQYYSICGYAYPNTTGVSGSGASITTSSYTCATNSQTITFPVNDPLGSTYHYKCINCSATAYTICPDENIPGGTRLETENCSGSPGSCCLTSLQ